MGFKLGRVNAKSCGRYVTVGNGDICIPTLYLLSAFLTTLAMIELCKYFAKIPGSGIVGIFGKHTLAILCTHWLIGRVLSVYMEYGKEMFLYVSVIECILVACLEAFGVMKQKWRSAT